MLDFDREMELEDAGIDAFDFSLMGEEERRETLSDAGLDPDDYEMIEFDSSFDAWSKLQDAGLNLSDLSYRDEESARETLRDAGLDPDDYDGVSLPSYRWYAPSRPSSPPLPAAAPTKPAPSPQKPAPSPPKAPAAPATAPQKPAPAAPKAPQATASIAAVPAATGRTAPKPPASAPSPVRSFCQVRFPGSGTLFSYWADGLTLHPGDKVIVPVGDRGDRAVATVAAVSSCSEKDAPYPANRMKSVERLAMAGEEGHYSAKNLPTMPAPEKDASPAAEEAGSDQTETDRKNEAIRKDYTKWEKAKLWLSAGLVVAAIVTTIIGLLYNAHQEAKLAAERFQSGVAYYESGQYQPAYEAFNEAAEHGLTEQVIPYVELCQAQNLVGLRDYNGAIRAYDAIIAANYSDEVTGLATLSKKEAEGLRADAAQAYLEEGLAYFEDQDFKRARSALEKAQENWCTTDVTLHLLYCDAQIEYSAGRYEKAISYCESITQKSNTGELASLARELKYDAKSEITRIKKEEADRKAAERAEMRRYLRNRLPYVGMPVEYLNDTVLGKATHEYTAPNTDHGKPVTMDVYSYYSPLYGSYEVRCAYGKVTYVHKKARRTTSVTTYDDDDEDADEYYADEFASAQDFYEYYRDDFYDFEEAEDYYYEHGGW